MRMSLGLLFVGNFVFAVFRVQCKMTILVFFMVVTFTERAHFAVVIVWCASNLYLNLGASIVERSGPYFVRCWFCSLQLTN